MDSSFVITVSENPFGQAVHDMNGFRKPRLATAQSALIKHISQWSVDFAAWSFLSDSVADTPDDENGNQSSKLITVDGRIAK